MAMLMLVQKYAVVAHATYVKNELEEPSDDLNLTTETGFDWPNA